MKHTPGPWEPEAWTTGGGRIVAGVVFPRLHLYITSHNPNYADDARLIAAAPQMLEETHHFAEYLASVTETMDCTQGNFDGGSTASCEHCQMIAWMNRIDALLAKVQP